MGNSVYAYRRSQEEFRGGFLANPPGGLTWDFHHQVWLFPGEHVPFEPYEQDAFLQRRSQGDYRPYPADVDPRDFDVFHNEFVIDKAVRPELYEQEFMNGDDKGQGWEPESRVY